MNAQNLIQELENYGVVIAVDDVGLVLYPAGKIPSELKPLVKLYEAEIINMKSVQSPIEISAVPCLLCNSRLVRDGECAGSCPKPECVPCLCDIYHIRLDSDCLDCHAPLCVFCSGCQRAARTWREAQQYADSLYQ